MRNFFLREGWFLATVIGIAMLAFAVVRLVSMDTAPTRMEIADKELTDRINALHAQWQYDINQCRAANGIPIIGYSENSWPMLKNCVWPPVYLGNWSIAGEK